MNKQRALFVVLSLGVSAFIFSHLIFQVTYLVWVMFFGVYALILICMSIHYFVKKKKTKGQGKPDKNKKILD